MLHIKLICLGKLKESFWRDAESEYLKRLQTFAKIEIIELKEESFDEKNSPETIKSKEAEKIKNILEKNNQAFIIALDENGKQFSSKDFSKKIDGLCVNGETEILFIIGGPRGLDRSILQLAKLTLSFSSFTFTHQMIRVFLWEQLYRAFMISNGRQYHY